MADAVVLSAPTGRAGRRRAVLLAASIALHGAVLAPMALRLFETDLRRSPVNDTPILVQMEPRPLLAGEQARAPATPPSRAATDTRPLTGTVAGILTPRKRDEDEDAPSTPAPRAAGGPAAGAPAPPDGAPAWRLVPEGLGAAVGRSMRTGSGGCRIMDGRLSAAEQALCDERFNAAAGAAGPPGPRTLTPGEARREAEFARAGARALAQYEARRAPLAGGVGIMGPADCVGSNLGTGCAGAHLDPALRQGATSTIRQGSNKLAPVRPLPGQPQ